MWKKVPKQRESVAGERIGAEDGIRTRDLLLGKEMLYQLSHFRPLRGAEGQNRTDDTSIFSAVLYLLSYLGAPIHVNDSTIQCQVEPACGNPTVSSRFAVSSWLQQTTLLQRTVTSRRVDIGSNQPLY